MTARDDRQLAGIRRLAAHLADRLQADFSLRLWTGERLPLGPAPSGDLAIAIRSPTAVTRLMRRPRMSTVVDLIAAGELDIEGGTLLDLAARRGAMNTRGLVRRLDKRLVITSLLPFLFGRAKQAADHAYSGAPAQGRDEGAQIRFHYDLSNEFYALFLDPEMVYSCAYFPRWDASLEDAQRAKLEMICRKLRLQPGERLLDIGCGWGGLICHAALKHGVIAHGITLSAAQLAFAQAMIASLGLQDRVTVELRDYRAVEGSFDKIASIGMFEHVGFANHAAYFARMHTLLRPGGLLLNHAIARRAKRSDRRFRRKRAEYDALTRYVFPGAEVDHIGMSLANLERHGFEIHDVEAWREHYALTCRRWCERLAANRAAAEREVGAEKTRMWLVYLAGCSLGFDRGTIGIFQTLASRRSRGPSGLPPTREDLYRLDEPRAP